MSDIARCGSCRFWERSGPDSPITRADGIGKCLAAVEYFEAADWDYDCDYDRHVLRPEYKRNILFVNDGEGYIAELLTMETFGCILHEEA
jgi:hypothetical protein